MSNNKLEELKKELENLKDPKRAVISQKFFKTGSGEYGEGDVFLGIIVPTQRRVAKKYNNLELKDLQELLNSNFHEFRLTALIILESKYRQSGKKEKKNIFNFYLSNYKNINNWDLVDITAPKIVGDYLLDKPRNILYKLAKSVNIWQKRTAIISTFAFIRQNDFVDVLNISEILLQDNHDLIHKAVGWMLREVGKRDQEIEEEFLRKHYRTMPRVMLRYAIEKFNENKRKFYLSGNKK